MTEQPFSRTLRESTQQVHERAHHSAYMDALLDGSLTLAGYARLAAQYYFIYGALEKASDAMAGDPVGGPFVIDELRRMPALIADLEHLLGPGWESAITPVPATERYVRRLDEVASTWPGGYVAHHYTRYLGDLAGGQVVGSLLHRKHGIRDAGARFYDFSAVGNPSAFRKRYRQLLDTAPWGAAQRSAIVDETLTAFELNIAVLADLADDIEQHVAA
ncbi:heme oxygenase [Prauserella marina]|uniref:Heme oxygenase n=1 Tax=Prauserella marina TaxID=530584 RepID=A0A222VWI1_9PSEU|nr:biliverdin-producing heme oxygenase [Prauserella marina]ASR38192.1 heme oxygenase [Prauserella marina]PWV78625.1 heme oxygenase [Prauserella marina]SDC90225.1 heme oxygenase [Prauserella marina]